MNPLTWLSLKEWLLVGLVGAVVAYHYWDRHEAVKDAVAEVQKNQQLATDKAVIAAQAEWNKTNSGLDMLTLLDHQQFTATMSKLSDDLTHFKGVYHETVIHSPLPADCVASPDRVRAVNSALGHQAGPVPAGLQR